MFDDIFGKIFGDDEQAETDSYQAEAYVAGDPEEWDANANVWKTQKEKDSIWKTGASDAGVWRTS